MPTIIVLLSLKARRTRHWQYPNVNGWDCQLTRLASPRLPIANSLEVRVNEMHCEECDKNQSDKEDAHICKDCYSEVAELWNYISHHHPAIMNKFRGFQARLPINAKVVGEYR